LPGGRRSERVERIQWSSATSIGRRVIVVNTSRLLVDILREAFGDAEIEQVRGSTTAEALRSVVQLPRANLVVVSVPRGELSQVHELVEELLRLKVVVVVEEGDRGVMYELTPQPTFIGPVSGELLFKTAGGPAG
jgi:hypothetical protein